eukprot:6059869-Pyramimonas_sp.AAC.1
MLRDLEEAASRTTWTQASKQYLGGGLERGVDNESYRALLRHLSSGPDGSRLAETMTMIAAAGCWPKLRKVEMIKHFQGSDLCDRCKEKP